MDAKTCFRLMKAVSMTISAALEWVTLFAEPQDQSFQVLIIKSIGVASFKLGMFRQSQAFLIELGLVF